MRIGFKSLVPAAALLLVVGVAPALAQPPQASSTQSQNKSSHEDNGIGIGIDAGIIRNNLHADNSTDLFKSKTGTLLGLWIGGNKNGVIGFTGEFNYVTKKAGDGTDEVTFHALEIPAVFHINVGQRTRNGVGGYGVIGPAFTINLNKSLKSGLSGDNFKSADTGIMFGAGIEAYRIGVEVRANWGLTNISSEGQVSTKTRAVEILGKFRIN